MAFQSPLKSYVMIGEESSYGTAVARTRGLTFRSESLRTSIAKIMSGDIYRVGLHKGQRLTGNQSVAGDINFVPRFSQNVLQMLLKHVFGSVATSQPDITSAGTVYRHTFTPADTLPTGLSIEVQKDQKAFLYVGCKLPSLRLSYAQGNPLEATVSVMGRSQTDSTPGTALVLTEGNMAACTNAVIQWAGGSLKVLSGDVTYTNPLQEMRTTDSVYTLEPFRNGHTTVAGSLQVFFEDIGLWSNFMNMQQNTTTITFTGAVITGAYSYDLQLTLPIGELTDANPPSNGEGPIVYDISIEGFLDDANTSICTARLTNTNSAA